MQSETDNLPFGGTDNAHPPTALDHPDNLNFDEPDDELDNQQGQEGGTDDESETVEINDDQETVDAAEDDDTTTDEAEDAAEATDAAIKDDVIVMVNGEQIALGDLKAGYMKQADYSRKTQKLSNQQRDLEALSTRVHQSVNAVAQFISSQIPAKPDPTLAMTDPGRFVQETAMHDAAMGQINQILQQAGEVQDVSNKLTDGQRSELLAQENAKLAEAFPQTATNEGRQKFFDRAVSVGKELGYSPEELSEVTDHRMFALAHYAKIGMEAEAARKKAQTKVADLPPVAPQRRQQGQGAARTRSNQEAMKRLSSTGSIHDAVKIDFD